MSGLRATWLQPSTRSHVRARTREMTPNRSRRRSPAEFARTTSPRPTRAKAASGLIATGRAAASRLNVGLMDDTRQVPGYTRRGTVEHYARENFMVSTPSGRDVVYDNTLPIDYGSDVMPAAVVDADLAASTDTRERSGGLRALNELRRDWQARH